MERMDVGELMVKVDEEQKRERWMFERGLKGEDVYGKHAAERYKGLDALATWVVAPKGMIFAIDGGGPTGVDDPILMRNPKYQGEHWQGADCLRRYYDPKFGKGWSGYVGRVPPEQRDREHNEPNHHVHKRLGYPNPVWNRNFFRVKTWGWVHYKHDKTYPECQCNVPAVMD